MSVKTANENTGYITQAEAARWLGCHPNTVRNMIRDGRLRARRMVGPSGFLRVDPESVVRTMKYAEWRPAERPRALDSIGYLLCPRCGWGHGHGVRPPRGAVFTCRGIGCHVRFKAP